MVSGLGMSPGKHLQMGFPSLKAEKYIDWLLNISITGVVVKKATEEVGIFHLFNTDRL
jgi:hypothetical protein